MDIQPIRAFPFHPSLCVAGVLIFLRGKVDPKVKTTFVVS